MGEPIIDLDDYFRRIGYAGPTEATLATLSSLQSCHAGRIPFENLDVLLGRPIMLDPGALQRKLVREGRGGYCFEHNTLFLHVLRSWDFQVTALAARVLWRRPLGTVTPRTHMLLRVELPEGPFLADVGFGGATPTSPLAFVVGVEQPTPLEPFRLLAFGAELELQLRQGVEWETLYRFALEAQHPIDRELPNWFVSTHPDSFFVNHLVAARPTLSGRHGLLDAHYSFREPHGGLRERRLEGGEAILELLEREFRLGPLKGDERDALIRRLSAPNPATSR